MSQALGRRLRKNPGLRVEGLGGSLTLSEPQTPPQQPNPLDRGSSLVRKTPAEALGRSQSTASLLVTLNAFTLQTVWPEFLFLKRSLKKKFSCEISCLFNVAN